MVSQSNATGSSGRRQRPNTPKAKPVSRSKKTKRYPFSDSEDDTTPSSMDSTAPTSPPVDAVDVGSPTKFPRRLFAPVFFPTQLRLNIYSKANVIASVASALKGSSAMDRLLCSQFSKLFRLPVARCPNSTKLIGSLLCRKLITIRKYELWFTFGNHPLRFSVDEFKEITGLNCGVFDVEDSETEVNEPGSMWKLLFDTTVDLKTPEHNEPDVPPESGRSPNEDLKSWILEQFQNLKNGIYERLDQFEKTLCDHFGVPLPNIHNKGKRKVGEDDHGYSGSPKSVENQYKKQRPNLKSRKINSTVPKPGQEMHSYPLRSTDVLEGTIGNTQPGFSRETRENNENSTLLTPQFDQNATDKKDDTYIGEKAVDVKWDEANPHAYSAVKEVPVGERPSSDPNPESAPDFASTRSEDNVGPVSTNLSGKKTHAPIIEGVVPDSMAVQNPTSPVEEDENYESCKENISFDSQLQGKRPRAVEDMPGSEPDEDDNYVESGGKRVPKKSQKIRGVYTPDARLKGLFMSEKKAEYRPLPKTNRAIFKKFSDILSENVEQQFAIKTNHIVTNSFFLGIATPGNWLPDEHMHVIMQMLWRRRGSVLQKDRRVMCDPYFTKIITSKWSAFSEAKDKLHFDWGTNIASYVTGMCRGKNLKLQLGRDIDVYVGFTDYLIKEGERTYAWNRFQGIYHNNRGGDCGPCAAKFMEMHSNGDGKEEMSRITDKVVDKFRKDCYEEFVSDFQVANEAEMK
uniref:Ubiquitin-like protease family profile domain-containing protein n=1 Tax=Brassica oleracea var. oleracea TaxID=109376 RepID=A0A0D3EAF3_BRAOL